MTLQSKREQLVSYYTPLSKFTGHFDEYDVVARKGDFAKEGQQDAQLKFSNLKNIVSDTPYEYKTTVLALKFSNALQSGYVLFEDSIALVLGKPEGTVGIDNVVGMDLDLEREDNHFFFIDAKTKKESKGTVWRVIGVAGKASATTSLESAIELLEGKTKEEFPAIAIANSSIKKDSSLCNTIIEGTFFESDDVTNVYEVVEGKYTKKA